MNTLSGRYFSGFSRQSAEANGADFFSLFCRGRNWGSNGLEFVKSDPTSDGGPEGWVMGLQAFRGREIWVEGQALTLMEFLDDRVGKAHLQPVGTLRGSPECQRGHWALPFRTLVPTRLGVCSFQNVQTQDSARLLVKLCKGRERSL